MNYFFRWTKSALSELASLWLAADSHGRQAITRASHAIDEALRVNPHDQGESRPDGRRIFFAPPLGVLFRVDEKREVVQVIQVWRY